MDTQFGPTLAPDDFEPPFDKIVAQAVENGCVLYQSLAAHMRPQWTQRPLEILVIDNVSLNACAMAHHDCDRIYIFRGAVEQVHGTILGLLSTPSFFPTAGDIKNEVRPQNLPGGRFPAVPTLRSIPDADRHMPLFFPKDQTRMTVSQIMADLALEFLVYHEIGHVVGGHLEVARSSGQQPTLGEFHYATGTPGNSVLQPVLECDADAFACHVTSSVHIHEKMAVSLHNLVNASEWQPKDFALITYLMAVGVLFRVLYPNAPLMISDCRSSHPHPAVRACIVASSAMARGLSDGSFSLASLKKVAAESVGNIEAVWADLCLSGQNPQPSEVWAQAVNDAAMRLFASYVGAGALLDQHARLPRRWDDCVWPKSQESP